MNIVILGPQGSGKGTQAELIAEKFNLLHIETGEILRKIADSNNPLSKEIKRVMIEGKLVSDVILQKVLTNVMEDTKNKNGFIFDGTPRDIAQYDLMKEILPLNLIITRLFSVKVK